MHGLIFETSVWLLAESTRLLPFLGHTPRITACQPAQTPSGGDSRDQTCEIIIRDPHKVQTTLPQSADHPQQVASIPDPSKYFQ